MEPASTVTTESKTSSCKDSDSENNNKNRTLTKKTKATFCFDILLFYIIRQRFFFKFVEEVRSIQKFGNVTLSKAW